MVLSRWRAKLLLRSSFAPMVELVDTLDSKSSAFGVKVRVLLGAYE